MWTIFLLGLKYKLCVCAQLSIGLVGWHFFFCNFFSNNVSAIKENTSPKCLKRIDSVSLVIYYFLNKRWQFIVNGQVKLKQVEIYKLVYNGLQMQK